jgi:hypothetical protein
MRPEGDPIGTFLQPAATRYIAIFVRLEEPYNLPKYDRHYKAKTIWGTGLFSADSENGWRG